jgi:hypothetical protein
MKKAKYTESRTFRRMLAYQKKAEMMVGKRRMNQRMIRKG